jgi:dihydrofolate reductase
MAKLVFELNQSLDGYVDHDRIPPEALFPHWIERTRAISATVYGRRMYDIMRYWDEADASWGEDERAYATAWRRLPKYVASRTLGSVGDNATLLGSDVTKEVAELKNQLTGEIEVAGPEIASVLADLVDEYRLYVHPVVLGHGKPLFAAERPPLRLIAHDRIAGDVVRLTYIPA